jgi:glycyl-tRNA synthetase
MSDLKHDPNLMEKLVSLAKRRGFIFPGSEIYGGLANSWDYGPLGVELKNNIKRLWWKRFVQERGDMVGIDAALMMNPKVWKASGHVDTFNDPLVEDKKTNERFRLDHLLEAVGVEGVSEMSFEQMSAKVKEMNLKSPKGNELTEPKKFNMMLETYLGPVKDDSNKVYLRPETAQAMFVDFPQIVETTRMRVPFGVAQIGKAFRNEITPGNFIFRQREFEQMEIEFFVKPEEAGKWFEYWLEQQKNWLKDIGVDESRLHYIEVPEADRAHYSKRSVDTEFDYPFGQKELYGIAYRTDYDLSNHQVVSKEDMSFRDPETGEKYIPHVIEPTFGLDRTILVTLLSAYTEIEGGRTTTTESVKESEVVLRLDKKIAPIKVAVLPLSKKDELARPSQELAQSLRKHWVVQYDETASIGKRYRRQDEIGTPYCVTYDFDTVNDNSVTVRDRDTMQQERVAIPELTDYLKEKLEA